MSNAPIPTAQTERISRWACSLALATAMLVLGLLAGTPAPAQEPALDDSCVVSVLNRTAPVDEAGAWVLPNVPSGIGQVRVRATCVDEGVTRSGQSGFFTVPQDGVIRVGEIDFDAPAAVPERIVLSAPSTTLGQPGETVALRALAEYPGGATADVTASVLGTNYTISNPAVATVSPDGVVTAVASGTVIVLAANEGASGFLTLKVVLSGDSDGDGIPDDLEVSLGLDPNDPVDALADPDEDGLPTGQELDLGLDPFDPDTDGDDLSDGDEVNVFGTQPLLFDTDGDQISDGLEARFGTDPLDPASFDLAPILASLTVEPTDFLLLYDSVIGEGSRRLDVIGGLVDGTEIDLRSRSYGTAYSSSDLSVVSFGAEDGRVFAGQDGMATVTVQVAGFSATSDVTVEASSPQALAALSLPGTAVSVAVSGDYAFVATHAGLVVADVRDLTDPFLVGPTTPLQNPADIEVQGSYAYVAEGSAGVRILDVSDPAMPFEVGQIPSASPVHDVEVSGALLVSAVGGVGLRLYDVGDPAAPTLVSEVSLPGGARRVGIALPWMVALSISTASDNVHVIDATDPSSPVRLGSTRSRDSSSAANSAADVAVRGTRAFIADGGSRILGGLRIVDFSIPDTPVVVGSSGDAFGLVSVAVEDRFAVTADYFFVNDTPVFDVGGDTPLFTATVDFAQFDDTDGADVSVRDGAVFMVGERYLYLGRYRSPVGEDTVPPAITLQAPADGAQVRARHAFSATATASDDRNLRSVRFFTSAGQSVEDFTAPYSATLTAPASGASFTVQAIALDWAGNAGTSEVVDVVLIPDDSPVVTILAPADGTVVSEGSLLEVAATASDDVAILGVDFLLDGVLQETVTAPPYRAQIPVPLGITDATVTVEARDSGAEPAVASVGLTVIPDAPPEVYILEPSAAGVVTAGGLIRVVVGATDDVGVDSVFLDTTGQTGGPDAEPPYELDVQVPLGASEVRIQAVAVDTLGQEGRSAELVFPVGSDPLTTVIGSVVDGEGSPVVGASVNCRSLAGSTVSDGSFSIAGVPTTLGDVRCRSRFTDAAGQGFTGVSALVPPVPAGVTDVGQIVLEPFSGFLYPGAKLFYGGFGSPALEVADLDADGRPDLLALDDFEDLVRVGLARADGTYADPVGYATASSLGGGFRPEDLEVADFDGDGRLDVLTVNTSSNDLSLLRGNGDGTLGPAETFSLLAGRTLESGDLDGDGRPELVIGAESSSEVRIFTGDPAAGYQLVQTIATSGVPDDLALADIDLDGALDLLIPARSSATLRIHRGLGDGTFLLDRTVSLAAVASAVTVADLDADGLPDLVVTDTAVISAHPGLPDGSFGPERILAFSNQPLDLEVADLDLDGVLDLAAATDCCAAVLLLSGETGLTFRTERRYAAGIGPSALAAADFNGDGVPDLAVGRSEAPSLAVLLGRGDGSFLDPVAVGPFASFEDLIAIDLGLDGALDLAGADVDEDRVLLYRGVGDGTFTAPELHATGACPFSLTSADVNGDGEPDVLTANACSGDVSVLLGDGAGSLGAESRFAAGGDPDSIAVGDFDEDGAVDAAVVNYSEETVSILLGAGDGTFQAPVSVPVGSFPEEVVVADFDGDGHLDLAAVNSGFGSEDVSVLLGRGDGTFDPQVRYPAAIVFPTSLAAADVDQNGSPDLVVTTLGATDEISVLLGVGDGTFAPAQVYAAGFCPKQVVATDLNLDGLEDLVTANVCGTDVSVLLHR